MDRNQSGELQQELSNDETTYTHVTSTTSEENDPRGRIEDRNFTQPPQKKSTNKHSDHEMIFDVAKRGMASNNSAAGDISFVSDTKSVGELDINENLGDSSQVHLSLDDKSKQTEKGKMRDDLAKEKDMNSDFLKSIWGFKSEHLAENSNNPKIEKYPPPKQCQIGEECICRNYRTDGSRSTGKPSRKPQFAVSNCLVDEGERCLPRFAGYNEHHTEYKDKFRNDLSSPTNSVPNSGMQQTDHTSSLNYKQSKTFSVEVISKYRSMSQKESGIQKVKSEFIKANNTDGPSDVKIEKENHETNISTNANIPWNPRAYFPTENPSLFRRREAPHSAAHETFSLLRNRAAGNSDDDRSDLGVSSLTPQHIHSDGGQNLCDEEYQSKDSDTSDFRHRFDEDRSLRCTCQCRRCHHNHHDSGSCYPISKFSEKSSTNFQAGRYIEPFGRFTYNQQTNKSKEVNIERSHEKKLFHTTSDGCETLESETVVALSDPKETKFTSSKQEDSRTNVDNTSKKAVLTKPSLKYYGNRDNYADTIEPRQLDTSSYTPNVPLDEVIRNLHVDTLTSDVPNTRIKVDKSHDIINDVRDRIPFGIVEESSALSSEMSITKRNNFKLSDREALFHKGRLNDFNTLPGSSPASLSSFGGFSEKSDTSLSPCYVVSKSEPPDVLKKIVKHTDGTFHRNEFASENTIRERDGNISELQLSHLGSRTCTSPADRHKGYVSNADQNKHRNNDSQKHSSQMDPDLIHRAESAEETRTSMPTASVSRTIQPSIERDYFLPFPLCIPPLMSDLPSACGCGYCKNCRARQTLQMMQTLAESIGREIHDVIPDGNCMFRSIIDQLRMQGEVHWTSMMLRLHAVDYLRRNPHQEDGTHIADFLSADSCSWEEYLENMEKNAEWGDNIILRGLADVIGRNICIISAFGNVHNQTTVAPSKTNTKQKDDVVIGHIDDQHYVSLRTKDWQESWSKSARQLIHEGKDEAFQPYDSDGVIKLLGMEDVVSAVDAYTETPLYHLHYITKRVIPDRFLVFLSMETIKNVTEEVKGTYAYGSAAEGLAVSLPDHSLKSKLTSEQTGLRPYTGVHYYFLFDVLRVSSRINRNNEDSLGHVLMHTQDEHPGYLRLACHPLFAAKNPDVTKYLGTTAYVKNILLSKPSKKSTICVFKCDEWPDDIVSTCQNRNRPSGWPDKDILQKALQEDLLVMPFTHPDSEEPEAEWRFCFGKPEAVLSASLNKMQIYCFHVFQLLIRFHVDDGNFLKRYYLKNVFFSALETVDSKHWTSNVGACIIYMIDRTILAFKDKNLPQYFIPENNLIDYIDSDVCQRILSKLESLRHFPVMSLILLAEGHGLTSTWAIEGIMEDFSKFGQHRDIQKSIMEVFIPTVTRDVRNEIQLGSYRNAAKTIIEASYDVCGGPLESVFSTEDLLQQIVYDLPVGQSWWLCFFLDLFYKTNFLHLLLRNLKGTPLCQLIGTQEDSGTLWSVNIPHRLLRETSSCQTYGADLGFLVKLCYELYQQHVYDQAAFYSRILIRKMKKSLDGNQDPENPVKESSNVSDETLTTTTEDDVSYSYHQQVHKQQNYSQHLRSSMIHSELSMSYIRLYLSCTFSGQPELFTEYVEEFEDLCDLLPSKENYKTLADIWWALGSREKYNEAMDKSDNWDGR